MRPLLFTPQLDTRAGKGRIASRIGLSAEAHAFTPADDLFKIVDAQETIDCVLVDEAQFLSRAQVYQLGEIADQLDTPVIAYGLRTDFQGNLFEGSRHLLAWADKLVEIKTICHCGSKATMVVRLGSDGQPARTGTQIQVGGNETYVSMCRKHWKEALNEPIPK